MFDDSGASLGSRIITPNWRLLNTLRWAPVTIDRTLLIREWWLDCPDSTLPQSEIIELDWTTTVAEDFDIMVSVQQGPSSRGYRPGPLIMHPSHIADVHSENTVPHLDILLLDVLGD